MTTQGQVKIGPEFFAKAKNDYANWQWAWVREILQNSIDSLRGRADKKIVIDIAEIGDHTTVYVSNNGEPMTEDILINKLLALGGSGKNFDGSVGGFGLAKNLLYFCHNNYQIRSGYLGVDGSGASYDLNTYDLFVDGTTSRVEMSGKLQNALALQIDAFAKYAQWDGELVVNGAKLHCGMQKGSRRRDLSFGTVYTNKSDINKLVVRINGIPMFFEWVDLDRCVVVELNGISSDVMTSNRDSLVYKHRQELSDWLRTLAVDKRKALKVQDKVRYQHFNGERFSYRKPTTPAPNEDIVRFGESLLAGLAGPGIVGNIKERAAQIRALQNEVNDSALAENFIIRNDTDMKVPDYYVPSSKTFGTYAQKLVKMWGRMILELHRLFEHEATFSIGFGFDDTFEASFEKGGFGNVYYVNPVEIVKQDNSASKSFKKRFALTERDRLLSIAVHEFAHGLGFSDHNEDYACKLTDLFGTVMKNRKKFNWCFQ